MRQVGTRREPALLAKASGELLAQGARFNEALAHLTRTTFIPKGVFRFKSHQAANQFDQDCLVRGMAKLALERRDG